MLQCSFTRSCLRPWMSYWFNRATTWAFKSLRAFTQVHDFQQLSMLIWALLCQFNREDGRKDGVFRWALVVSHVGRHTKIPLTRLCGCLSCDSKLWWGKKKVCYLILALVNALQVDFFDPAFHLAFKGLLAASSREYLFTVSKICIRLYILLTGQSKLLLASSLFTSLSFHK